jgi:ribonuclease HI
LQQLRAHPLGYPMTAAQKKTEPPSQGILYADGASRGNPGPAGAGAILLDNDGNVLAEISEPLGRATNNQAEYHALVRGLEEALKVGTRRIRVFMDSELIVFQIQGVYKVKAPGLLPLWQRARALVTQFDEVRFAAVPRTQNTAADRLASRAAKHVERQDKITPAHKPTHQGRLID